MSKYRQLLFRADVGRKKWERYYDGQKSLMVYFVFVCLISPAFLYYNWHIFIAYFVTAVLFATVCTIKFEFSTEYKIGRVLNRFVNSNPYINTIRFLMFSLYILGCAVIIVFEPRRIPVEFIFVIIIGMRVQLARGKNVISFFHWEADNGVKAIQQDDKA